MRVQYRYRYKNDYMDQRRLIWLIKDQRECVTFLLPWACFTIPKIYRFLLTSSCTFSKLEWSFLRLGFACRYYLCAFRSNFPIDLVELCAAVNCPLICPFISFSFYTLSFLFASILYFLGGRLTPLRSSLSIWDLLIGFKLAFIVD